MFLQLGENPTIVVSSSEHAREVLKIHDLTFSDRPLHTTIKIISYGGKDLVFAPYSGHWRRVRKLGIMELLSSRRVQSFRSIREDEVSFVQQISSMSISGQIVNLSEGLLAVTNNVLLRAIMGSKFNDQNLCSTTCSRLLGCAPVSKLTEGVEGRGGAKRLTGAARGDVPCSTTSGRLGETRGGEGN